ncbi:MAG TPA: hypothetical protein VGM88_34070 [Kofleriaceae bacterium]
MIVGAGCGGDDGGGGTVNANLHVLRGAAGGSGALARAAPTAAVTGDDGLWFLSPDEAMVTIDSVVYMDATGNNLAVPLTGCTPMFQRSAMSFTSLLDCPIAAPIGTWAGVTINVSSTAQVLLDPTASPLVTTATGVEVVSQTSPTTGVFATVTVPSGNSGSADFPNVVYFDAPLEITSDPATASLSVLVDMNHTLFADVSGGTGTFNTSLPISPASVIASPTGTGSVSFYSATGTAGSVNGGAVTGDDTGSMRFYSPTAGGQPGFAFLVTAGPGEAYPLDASMSGIGGYLARDPSGTICWANAASDMSWAHYSQYCTLPEADSLGALTTLSCKHADPAPTPTSGDTYASGCPAMTSPDFTEQLMLVAN